MTITVVPAYGRDYKTLEEALKDWNEEKDFLIADASCPWDGAYVNKPQLSPGDRVKIRYNKRTQAKMVTV